MTDGSRRDEERERPSREEEEERTEERDRRSDELREAWRRNHPSEGEEGEKGRPMRSKGRYPH
jgi:hypothetical protein